jgi:hypothetical protein
VEGKGAEDEAGTAGKAAEGEAGTAVEDAGAAETEAGAAEEEAGTAVEDAWAAEEKAGAAEEAAGAAMEEAGTAAVAELRVPKASISLAMMEAEEAAVEEDAPPRRADACSRMRRVTSDMTWMDSLSTPGGRTATAFAKVSATTSVVEMNSSEFTELVELATDDARAAGTGFLPLGSSPDRLASCSESKIASARSFSSWSNSKTVGVKGVFFLVFLTDGFLGFFIFFFFFEQGLLFWDATEVG